MKMGSWFFQDFLPGEKPQPRSLAAFAEDLVLFASLYNSSCRGSDRLFWLAWAPGTQVAHINADKENM